MRGLSLAIVAALVALPAVNNASAQGTQKFGVLGYMDPTTGKFTPRSSINPAAGSTLVTGTIEFKLKASVGSYIASSVAITCSADISPADESFQEDVQVYEFPAKRSGDTATCDITMPYRWVVSSTKDLLSVTYSIQTSTSSLSAVNHTFTKYGETMPLPKNGAVTTISPAPPL